MRSCVSFSLEPETKDATEDINSAAGPQTKNFIRVAKTVDIEGSMFVLPQTLEKVQLHYCEYYKRFHYLPCGIREESNLFHINKVMHNYRHCE